MGSGWWLLATHVLPELGTPKSEKYGAVALCPLLPAAVTEQPKGRRAVEHMRWSWRSASPTKNTWSWWGTCRQLAPRAFSPLWMGTLGKLNLY